VARTSTLAQHAARSVDPYVEADELLPDIQNALAALADLEAAYEVERDRLERWNGPSAAKERLATLLAERHRAERERHMEQLTDLQRRMLLLCQPRVLH
jgi:hypothetical protein